jgi:signal transduction histidine kinase
MGFRKRGTVLAVGLVALMGLTLVVLAVLQYRWIGEVGRMERARLRASLENAAQQFRTEFNSELRRLCLSFELEPESLAAQDWDRLIERYDYWLSEDRHTKLVEDVFLLTIHMRKERELLWLDFQSGRWLPSAWPSRIDPIRQTLDRRLAGQMSHVEAGRFSDWQVLPTEFVLIQALVVPGTASAPPEMAGFLLLVLNRRYFQNEFLPGMIQQYFGDRPDADFEAAIVMRAQGQSMVCSSDAPPAARLLENPDLRVPLLWDRSDIVPPEESAPLSGARIPFAQPNLPVPMLRANEGNNWELVADFRDGPLDAIVSRSRLRSLAVSFGVLLLLGMGMTLIVWGARRSHRLAEMQMRFVAGVSHDLRTPLAVICTAADNLAEGVVENSASRIKEYGALIRSEGRKLSAMVEQILQYASLRSNSGSVNLQPVSIDELLRKVLADEKPSIDSLGFNLEVKIPPDLPAALGDRPRLEQALRNLVSNALKHGSSSRWIRIRADRVPASGREEISISVEDRGPGIDPEDLSHVFEPFYRGRNASGVPGSGLGLTVVEQSVAMMGGRVAVRSEAGRGSIFTIVLPSAGRLEAGTAKGS